MSGTAASSATTTTTSTTSSAGESNPDVKLQIRILIDERSVGGLIGKGGNVINKIRQDSGCRIDISDAIPGAKKRIVTGVGTHTALANGLHLIADRLLDQKKKGGDSSSGYDTKSPPASGEAECNLTLLIPNSQVGGIIGKAGAKINKTRESSGAHIKISEKPLDNSTEKAVTLRGASKSVYQALQQICLQLTEVADKTARIPYVPRPEFSPYGGYPSYYGPPTYREYGLFAAPPKLYGGPLPKVTLGTQSVVIPVPDYLMGAVIGKSGSSINEIRARSGALIKIADLESGATERLITITGHPAATEMAVAMIHQRVGEWNQS